MFYLLNFLIDKINFDSELNKFDGYYNYSDKELYMDGKIYNQYFLRLVFNLNRRSFEETKGILISYSTYDNLIKVSNVLTFYKDIILIISEYKLFIFVFIILYR